MSPVWETVRRRALTCIDEVYPAEENVHAAFFPVDDFLLEGARFVSRLVPTRALGAGRMLDTDDLEARPDGSGSIPLPSDFIRLIRFRMAGWARPVVDPIYDADARYMQQFNFTLRGGEARPVVAVCDGGTRLEYYSSSLGVRAKVAEARYFGFETTDDDYPEKLIDPTAWKVAELVLSSMSDAGNAQLCAAKAAECIQTL